MREENKQTENQENSNIILSYLKNIYNSKISKSIRNILLKPNTKKTLFTILISFIFIIILTKVATAFDMDEINKDELIVAKNNGLISSLCFVQDLLTGNVARAVGALFILGCGWLFLIGSIKSWISILSLTIATTLIFGSAELAEVISGNNFTCKTIYEASENIKETPIYNEGICKLLDIDIYTIGQKWYICDSNIKKFNINSCTEIKDDTIINSDDKDVFLVTCQNGSFKPDENVFLRYKCNVEKEIFELISTEEEKEKGVCVRGCTISQIKEILNSYHAKSTLEDSKNTKFEILDNSGKLKNGSYYTSGTIINLDCLSDYTELNKEGEPDNKGLIAICTAVDSMAEFKVSGSCRGNCNLNNLSNQYKNTFTEWQKYNAEKEIWEDTKAKEFYFGDRVRIKTCDTDNAYRFDITNDPSKTPQSIIPDNEKLILRCGSAEHNKEIWIADNEGKSCIRYCNLIDYEYYNEHIWNRDCPLTENCKKSLTQTEILFKPGEKVGISACSDTTNYFLNTEGNYNKLFLKITCNSNGKWEPDDGLKCQKKCKLDSIPFYNYAKEWKVCRTISNNNNSESKCDNLEYKDIDNIVDGDSVEQIVCQKSYGFNATKGSTFICNNGTFKRELGNVDEVCMPQCHFSLLDEFDTKSQQWQESNRDGIRDKTKEVINLKVIKENEVSNIRKYYTLKDCKEGYEIVNIENERNDDINNKYTTILCNANKRWEVIKQEVKCDVKKCVFNKETIKKDLESNTESQNDYNLLGLEYVNSWEIYSSDAEGKFSKEGEEYNITDNDTTREFGYGTEIKIKTCTNNNIGTYLLGDQDTILKCNSDAKWELITRSSIDNTRRCKIGVCKGLPTTITGSIIPFTALRKGNHYLIDGNIANFDLDSNVTDINEVYSENGSLIDADCSSPYREVKFGGTCTDINNCKVSFGGSCTNTDGCLIDKELWNGHYYYCDNGTWKTVGSCLSGCYGAPTLINQSAYNGNINNGGKFYNLEGETIYPNSSNIDTLYAEAGAILDAICNGTGYREVKFGGTCSYSTNCGGQRDLWSHYYYCDTDGTWKASGSCLKSCYGKPPLSDGSYLYPINNVTKTGTFYNVDGNTSITLTESNITNVYTAVNSDVDANCNNGYIEVKFGGDCTDCSDKWTHYYHCDENGNWKRKGSCIKGCRGVPTNLIANAASIYNAKVTGTVFTVDNTTNYNLANIQNMNNVYYGNNTTLQSSCNSGYFKVGTEIKYTCNNGSWNKSGNCIKVCNGGPTNVVANSSIVSGSGNMYNSSGAVVSFNANSVGSYYYADGYTIQGGCNSGYTKVGDVKYTCNNGSWTSSGSCIKKSGSITYNYTGGVQSFKPSDHNLVNGDVITLEVWGAQGGGDNGGKGGYTKAKYTVKNNELLYIKVGEGGGIGCEDDNGDRDGGGATYMVLENKILSNFSNDYKTKVLIVAGGGGGSASKKCSGGTGGGGNNVGDGSSTCNDEGNGGYLTDEGCYSGIRSGSKAKYFNNGSFGKGGNTSHSCDGTHGGAGGGGLCGGASGSSDDKYGGGGGGSGYCNTNLLVNCEGNNGVRTGNGEAKISW